MPAAVASRSSTNWCFTLYPDPEAKEPEQTLPHYDSDAMRYMVYQPEICPDTGRFHYQGFVILKIKTTLNNVKRLLRSNRIHVQRCNGTAEQNREYCTKEQSRAPGTVPTEHGTWIEQGKRNDIAAATEAIRSHGIRAAWNEHTTTMVRYHNGLNGFYRHLMEEYSRNYMTWMVLYIGGAGAGKSHKARSEFPSAYYKRADNKWFCGYDPLNHRDCIIDDFIGSTHMNFTFISTLCDKYPTNVEIKGGSLPFLCRHVVITSNREPEEWLGWNDFNDEQKRAFYRRVKTMLRFTNQQTPPRNILQAKFDQYGVDRDAWQRMIDADNIVPAIIERDVIDLSQED